MANFDYISPVIKELDCFRVCQFGRLSYLTPMCKNYHLECLHSESYGIKVVRRACKNLYIQFDLL